MYWVSPDGQKPFQVYCDVRTTCSVHVQYVFTVGLLHVIGTLGWSAHEFLF